MFAYHRHIHAADATASPRQTSHARWQQLLRFTIVGTLLLLAMPLGVRTWHWADRNVLHWGVTSAPPRTTLSQATLLQQVHAFQLATVKRTYASQAHQSVAQTLAAGPVRTSLPGWLAGQQLTASGEVTVTGGVDLEQITSDDITVTHTGKTEQVFVHAPAPQVQSSELVPGSLHMSTGSGLLNNLGGIAGISEGDLRNGAADQVIAVARNTALQQGILVEAGHEAQRRLQAFLMSLPHDGAQIRYTILIAGQNGQ